MTCSRAALPARGATKSPPFIAAQFEADGLEPAGDAGAYFQVVPFRSFRPDKKGTSLTLVRGGKEECLEFGKDFLTRGDAARKETSVEAGIVYVGYGVTAPEQNYDDYNGMDAKGKIVAVLFGAPPRFPTTLRAHHSSQREKAANAVAHGAIAMIILDSPVLEQIYGFKHQLRDLAFPNLRWLSPEGKPNDYLEELRATVFLSMEGVKKLFDFSGKAPGELYQAAQESRPTHL